MNRRINIWLWVLYPLGTVFLIIFSYKLLLSANANKLADANIKRKQSIEENTKVAALKTKLLALNGINRDQYLDDLKNLLTGIPASRKPWLTLGEINIAASRSGMVVSNLYGQVGEIKEASESATGLGSDLYVRTVLKVDNFQVLRKFFDELYKLRPLVKVRSLVWKSQIATIEIDVGYSPWPKLTVDVEKELNNDSQQLRSLIEKLKVFEDVETVNVYSATMSGTSDEVISPF